MKITKYNQILTPTRPPVLDHLFSIELTGEEMVRFFILSWRGECGDQHSRDDRFSSKLAAALGLTPDEVERLFVKHFCKGVYPK